MTISIRGSLLHGYDLGGGDQPWLFTTNHQPGDSSRPAWYNPAAPDDFAAQTHRRLLTSVGVHTDEEHDGYELIELADEHAGVHVERYSWESAPSFVLTAHATTAFYNTAEPLDLLELNRRRAQGNWETRLADALRCLGLAPHAPGPRWLLISSQ